MRIFFFRGFVKFGAETNVPLKFQCSLKKSQQSLAASERSVKLARGTTFQDVRKLIEEDIKPSHAYGNFLRLYMNKDKTTSWEEINKLK